MITLNSRTAAFAFAAIAAMAATLSTPAAAVEDSTLFNNVNLGALLTACANMGSACKLTPDYDDVGGFWIKTAHASVYCRGKSSSQCSGATFVPHNPEKGIVGLQPRPVVGGVSPGDNPGKLGPGGIARPIQMPVSVKAPVIIARPVIARSVTANLAGPARIALNVGAARHR